MPGMSSRAANVLLWVASVTLLAALVVTWARRLFYPYDLEWMEGGMLAHAWRMRQELPLYPEPGPDWTPFIYPPGYAAIVAALGSFVPLHPALGRVVSLLGTALASGSLVHVLHRRGASMSLSVGLVACFLGSYPATGAFLDLVRPDGAYIGLVALSVALALDGRRGTAASSGLVLAAAFLVKHNAATFGFPILLGLLLRDRRQALAFLGASLLPALALTGYLHWRTDGRYLVYLLQVPASHPWLEGRIWPGTVRELGLALGVLAPVGALFQTLSLARRGPLPVPLATVGPVLLGMLAVTAAGSASLEPEVGFGHLVAGLAVFGVGTFAGWALLRLVVLRRLPVDADDVLVFAVLAIAFALAGAMRAHTGGYLNVHLHLDWAVCLAFGWVGVGVPRLRWAVAGQAAISLAVLLAVDLVPDRKAREAGDQLVEALRDGEGPVLSPFASWLPTYAGHDPSIHHMALWDLDYRAGPWHDELDQVRSAVRKHRWPLAVEATQPFPYGLSDAYKRRGKLDVGEALAPRSGWGVAPRAVMVPKK